MKEYSFYYRGIRYERFGNGNINKTYLVYADKKYILQEINSKVFSNPVDVVENNIKITKYLREVKNVNTLTFVQNKKGDFITIIEGEHKRYFRCYEYIECFNLYEIPKSEKMFYEAGLAIGDFCLKLSEYSIDEIKYTIDNFHDIETSYEKFFNAFKENRFFRKKFCLIESNIIIKNNNCFSNLQLLYRKKEIPLRIVHNDTKISNILYNEKDEVISLIDLDTVMPGLLLYDYADGLRSGISNLKEDDRNINNMKIKFNMFESFTEGFLKSTISIISTKEINLLVEALEVIVYECGMRFLTDFLNNDIYFRTSYCNHNLIRARNQLHLFLKIKENEDKLKKIVQKCVLNVIKK